MSFILSRNLDDGPAEAMRAFESYRRHVQENRAAFPPGAYGLASSDWYFDSNDHRCPHDAWLERVTIEEVGEGERRAERTISIRVLLLGAYHDCHLEVVYPVVYSYNLLSDHCARGNRDWRYDEFRLSDSGHVIHEIEWAGSAGEESRWVIEASDVEFNVLPLSIG